MKKQGVFGASAFAVFLTVWLFPGVAHAQPCSASVGGVVYPSVTTAVAAVGQGPGDITVTGTCTGENVAIFDAHSITIQAPVPGGATVVGLQDNDTFDIFRSQFIRLVNLEIVGVPGSMQGVFITQASNVQIKDCNVHDNQGGGVGAALGSLLFLINTTIHNNTPSDGLDVFSGSNAHVSGTTIENNGSPGFLSSNPATFAGGVGVFVPGGTVLFLQNNLVQNNAEIGIVARNGGAVAFTGGATVQGHTIDGIRIDRGSHLQVNAPLLVQGNGGACTPQTPCSGIFGSGDSTLNLNAGTVSGNHGAGIFVEQGTNILLNGTTVSNNSGDGVHIQWISTADFRDFGAGRNTITGNGGASVFCDAKSLAIGNLTQFSNVKCGQNEE